MASVPHFFGEYKHGSIVMPFRRSTAIHEAGHAVIGRVLDMVCGAVSIEPDDDSAGHSICADPWVTFGDWDRRGKYRDFRTVIRGRMMTFMAGAEAEREIIGRFRGGDGDDQDQIALMVEGAGFDEQDLGRRDRRLRQATRHLVRRHRATIDRVAAALIRQGRLEADQVDALLPSGAA
jgi:hypothetical protein